MNTTAFELVRAVVQEMSGELGYEALVNPEPDTPLYGNSGVDSLSLVSIVAGVERAAEDRFQRRVVLADERAMSRLSSPYRTVGTLAELLHERLVE
jgi:acyl carrier protein